MTLQNKLILITGGARDIGRAITKNLAKNGANLAINFYGSIDEANSLENELKEDNIDALFLQGDMTSEVDVKNFIDQATTKFGTNIHGLVNVSGGLVERRTIDQMDLDFLNKVMNLNLNSSFLTIKHSYHLCQMDHQLLISHLKLEEMVVVQEHQLMPHLRVQL